MRYSRGSAGLYRGNICWSGQTRHGTHRFNPAVSRAVAEVLLNLGPQVVGGRVGGEVIAKGGNGFVDGCCALDGGPCRLKRGIGRDLGPGYGCTIRSKIYSVSRTLKLRCMVALGGRADEVRSENATSAFNLGVAINSIWFYGTRLRQRIGCP